MSQLPFLFAATADPYEMPDESNNPFQFFNSTNFSRSQNFSSHTQNPSPSQNSPPPSQNSSFDFDSSNGFTDEDFVGNHMTSQLFNLEQNKWFSFFERNPPNVSNNLPEEYFKPIHPSIHYSKIYIYSILLQIYLSHRCSYATIDSILKLLHLLLPNNSLPLTWKTIMKDIKIVGISVHQFDCCSHCNAFIFIDSEFTECPICASTKRSTLYYVQNSHFLSLMALYDSNFSEYMNWKCSKLEGTYVNKIVNTMNQELGEGDFSIFYSECHIDGIDCFKSGSYQLWPQVTKFKNIDYSSNKLSQFHFITSLFSVPTPRPVDVAILPYIFESNYRRNNSFDVFVSATKSIETLYWVGTTLHADGEAAHLLLGIDGFSSYYFCKTCPRKAINILNNPNNKRSNKRVMPYIIENERPLLRTNVYTPNEFGVKGYSVLRFQELFDPIEGIPYELLHTFYLGIIPILLKITKDKIGKQEYENIFSNSKEQFYLPNNFGRLPRNFIKFKNKLKAEEYKNILLIYALPLLGNAISNNSQIMKLWITARNLLICILEFDNMIEIENINNLSMKLYNIISEFGHKYTIPKVHMLEHLKHSFECTGSVYKNSLIHLENFNSCIRDWIHGTSNVQLQVINTAILNNVNGFLERFSPNETAAQIFLFSENKQGRAAEDCSNTSLEVEVLDKHIATPISLHMDTILQKVKNKYHVDISKYRFWKRCRINGCLLETMNYCENMKHNNSFVEFIINGNNCLGRVCYIFTVQDNSLFIILHMFQFIGQHYITHEQLYHSNRWKSIVITPSSIVNNVAVFFNDSPYEYKVTGSDEEYVEPYYSMLRF